MNFRANHEPELLTDRISNIFSCILLVIGRILMIIFILIAFASTVKAATRPTTTKTIVSVSTTQAVKGRKKAKQPGSVTGTRKPSKSDREELQSPSQSKKKTKNQEIEIVPPAPTGPKPKKASAKSSETKKSPNAVIATKNNKPAEVIQSVEPVNSTEESSTEENSTESSLKYVEPADVSSDSKVSTKDTSPASSTPKIDYDLDPFILSSVFDLKNYIGQFVTLNPNYTISFDSSHHIMRLQRNDPKSQQAGVESMTISLVGDLETNNPNPVSITILGIASNDNPSLKYRRVYIMPNVWGELIRIDGVDEYFYTAEAVVLKDVLAAMVEHPTGDDITENGLSPLYPSLQSTKFQE